MVIKNRNILLVSPESWSHLFVSKHHYAIHLAKRGNRVFFLNPPKEKVSKETTDIEDLWILNYQGFIAGLRFLPYFIRKYFVRKKFGKLEQLSKCLFDIVWSFDNSVFFDFNALPARVLSISHIMDLNQDFQTARAARSASVCFGVIPEIVEILKKYNSKSYYVRHGVSIPAGSPERVNLPGNSKKKALYTGNLDMHDIDWELLYDAANQNARCDFIFIGSSSNLERGSTKSKLSALNNVHLLPKVNSIKLRGFMNSCTVLLVAYKPNYYLTYASPHKIMEYLSVGKPIISTYTSDYDFEPQLLHMAREKKEWLKILNEVISNPSSKEEQIRAKHRIKFATENTYERQIQRIEKYIEDLN